MSEGAIARLDSIIAKYRRMPQQEFLLNEAYVDKGYDSNGFPAGELIFEVKPVNDEDRAANLIDQELPKSGQSLGALRIISLSSTLNPGKKYTPMTGEQIVQRAKQLKSFLELSVVQPPGNTLTGQPHLALDIERYRSEDPEIKVADRVDYRCTAGQLWRPNRTGEYRVKETLNGLRKGSSSRTRIKILQDMLLTMGYGDEMRFELYGWDGRYGKRTALAVAAFVRENDYITKIESGSTNGEHIDNSLAKRLVEKCEFGRSRFNYKVFLGTDWILKKRNLEKELNWLRWRHHTAQLQRDLHALTIATENGHRFAEDPITSPQLLITQWTWGKYDQFTEEAVRRFQKAALQGCRFDPVNQIIVCSLAIPTYHGSINGVLDDETRLELIRWFDDMEQVVNVEDVSVSDQIGPAVDLREAVIEAPMVGCCNLVFAGGTTELLLSTPTSIDGKPVTAEVLKQNLPYCLFLHRPVDDRHPFDYDNHRSSYRHEYHYLVGNVESVTDSVSYRFYAGTASEQKPEEYTAQYIDSGERLYLTARGWETEYPERGLKQDLLGNPLAGFDPALIEKYRRIYDRKYPGFFEKLAQSGRKLWKVQLELTDAVKPGMYLFKINHGTDRKPHPVKVFDNAKDSFDILHLTDIHIAARHEEIDSYLREKEDYNNPNERFRELIEMVNQGEITADFIIITGDLVDFANNYRPYDVVDNQHIFSPVFDMDANWRLLHYYITTDPGCTVPVFMCLGNHDYRPNPASVSHLINDFNLTQEEAELYPFDTRDQSFFADPLEKWILHRCYSDSLYADYNAAQYYFENLCPFTDYRLDIGNLNFLFLDSGTDENVFVSTYGLIDGMDKLYHLIIGHLPAPKAVGFSDKQVQWLQQAMVDIDGVSNILCMHSPVIKPPLNEMVPRYDSSTFMENDISDDVEDYDESCLIGGRNTLLELIGKGRFRLVLTGHTHLNVEIRCDPHQTPAKYFVANYSQNNSSLEYFNEQGNNLLLTTISGGVLGCEVHIELDDWLDSFTKNDVEQYFSHCGYRTISIGTDGKLLAFADDGIWRRQGATGTFREDTEVLARRYERQIFQTLIDNEVMPRVKKSFEIVNSKQPDSPEKKIMAVDDAYCENASIRAYIYFKSRSEPLDVRFCVTNLHVALIYKDLIFDPTFFDLYGPNNELKKPDRSNPHEPSHLTYQSIVGEEIAFTNKEAQAGMMGTPKEIKTFFYKKRPRKNSYLTESNDWSNMISDLNTSLLKRQQDFMIVDYIFEKAFGAPDIYQGPDNTDYIKQFIEDSHAFRLAENMGSVWKQWEEYNVLKENGQEIPDKLRHLLPLDADHELPDALNF